MVSDYYQKAFYYRTWALCQKNDIAFFTYKENLQNIIVMFALISLINGTCKIISDYARQIKSTK